jgi:DNA-directed RNA polymerase specialized sigma24 family protein
MKQLSTAGTSGAGFITPSLPYVHDAAGKEIEIRKHTSLLTAIARGFGFGEREACDLLEQVRAYALTHPAATCYPFRIWLSKIMVHACTFRIGSKLCSQSGRIPEQKQTGFWDGYPSYPNGREQNLQDMPLSFRAVYLLRHHLGFTTGEVAWLLNTTLPKVTERYAHAVAILAGQSRRHPSA